MSELVLAYLILLACLPVIAQINVVELTAEPHHHLVLENRFTRVFKVEAPPHASTLLHRHSHAYIYVSIGPAEFENNIPGKAPVKTEMVDGQASLVKGNFVHVLHNVADTPFRNVTIEILKPDAMMPAKPGERGLKIGPGYVRDTIFDTQAVRVSEMKLMPGATLPLHRHSLRHLVVAVADYDLRNEVKGHPAITLHAKPGDITWVNAGLTHSLTNTGKQPARWVAVEFK